MLMGSYKLAKTVCISPDDVSQHPTGVHISGCCLTTSNNVLLNQMKKGAKDKAAAAAVVEAPSPLPDEFAPVSAVI
jgi:hypothetical protein